MLHNILASKIFCEPLCRSIGKTHVRSECVSLLQTPSLELEIVATRVCHCGIFVFPQYDIHIRNAHIPHPRILKKIITQSNIAFQTIPGMATSSSKSSYIMSSRCGLKKSLPFVLLHRACLAFACIAILKLNSRTPVKIFV